MAVLPDFDMCFRRHRRSGDAQVVAGAVPAFRGGAGLARIAHLGVARTGLSRTEYAVQAEAACREFLGKEFDAAQWLGFAKLLDYLQLDAGAAQDYEPLAALLRGATPSSACSSFDRIDLFSVICQNLARAAVVTPLSRVVLEKPLGHDTASADLINEQVGAGLFGKTDLSHRSLPGQGDRAESHGAALRQCAVRAAVAARADQARADHRGRGAWRGATRQLLRQTGALRDMVQNHLLQLLCIMAMEPPAQQRSGRGTR